MVKPATLSDTARSVLAAAANRNDHLAFPPERLPAAAQRAVVLSLLKTGLLEEIAAEDDQPAWRVDASGLRFALRVTEAGLHAVHPELAQVVPAVLDTTAQEALPAAKAASERQDSPVPPTAAQDAPVMPPRAGTRQALRSAAQAVLLTWDDPVEGRPALPGAMDALRTALAQGRRERTPSAGPRQPRTGTKQEAVLALLGRPEGASGPQLIEATGWAPHTVRGLLAGLAKRGITVVVLDRVRQAGSGKGGKGSYTVYGIVSAPDVAEAG